MGFRRFSFLLQIVRGPLRRLCYDVTSFPLFFQESLFQVPPFPRSLIDTGPPLQLRIAFIKDPSMQELL